MSVKAAIRRHKILAETAKEPVIKWATKAEQVEGLEEAILSYLIFGKFGNRVYKKWLFDYFKKHEPKIYEDLKNVKSFYHPMKEAGVICRMASKKGGLQWKWLPGKGKDLIKSIKDIIAEDKKVHPSNHDGSVKAVSVQERVRKITEKLIAKIDKKYDEYWEVDWTGKIDFSAKSFMEANSVSPMVARRIKSRFETCLQEVEDAMVIKGTRMRPRYDKDGSLINDSYEIQIYENYGYLPKPVLKKMATFYQDVVGACQITINNNKRK